MPSNAALTARQKPSQAVPDVDVLPASAILTRAQVSALTGFSLPTLKRYAASGRGPRITRIEGLPRYRVNDLRDWLRGAA